MKKYNYLGISLEITRRCNLNCEHCLRGEPQNVDLSKAVIDRLIDNMEECKTIMLTGGEPLLAIDAIEYLVDRIIAGNIQTTMIGLITNGTVRDRRIIDILRRFCDSAEGRSAHIAVSSDSYHSGNDYERAIEFYKKAAEQCRQIEVGPNDQFGKESDGRKLKFVLAGRAKHLAKEHPETLPHFGVRNESIYDHRVSITGNTVVCCLYVTANGDLCIEESRSFETFDRMSIGNITNESMYDIINRHNENCLMSCRDVQMFEFWENYVNTDSDLEIRKKLPPCTAFTAKVIAMIAVILFPRVWEARKAAHKKFPLIPAQDIIKILPMPELAICFNNDMKDLLVNSERISIGEAVNYIDIELIEEADKVVELIKCDPSRRLYLKNDYEQIVNSLRVLGLLNKPNATIAPNRIYGTGDLFETEEFLRLEQINKKYMTGEENPDNSEVLQCTANQSTMDYIYEMLINEQARVVEEMTEQIKNMGPLSGALAGIMMAGMLFGGKK